MSGPIVRKYGFPNFEKIFGERGMQHGVDEGASPAQPAEKTAEPGPSPAPDAAEARPAPEAPKHKK
jgi:hypothetical protein